MFCITHYRRICYRAEVYEGPEEVQTHENAAYRLLRSPTKSRLFSTQQGSDPDDIYENPLAPDDFRYKDDDIKYEN